MDTTGVSDTSDFDDINKQKEDFNCFDSNRSNRTRSYFEIWDEDSGSYPFITRHPDDNSSTYCIYCGKKLCPQVSSLLRHMNSSTHQMNAVVDGFSNERPWTDKEQFIIDVANAEIRIAAMYSARNVAFAGLLQNTFVQISHNGLWDNEKIVINRWWVKYIFILVLSPAHISYLQEILQGQRFSITINESTDISIEHALCIMVRFNHESESRIREVLWDYKPIYINEQSHVYATT